MNLLEALDELADVYWAVDLVGRPVRWLLRLAYRGRHRSSR